MSQTRTGSLLLTDTLERYKPLGAFGQPVYLSHVQIKAAVRQKLGARYADLFARPERDPRDGAIRWVAEAPGEAVRWRDLPPDRQMLLALTVEELRSGFAGYVRDLRANKRAEQAQAFASLLETALKVPSDDHLFFVGDQPVTSFWGFSDASGASIEALAVAPAKVTPPPVSPEPVSAPVPRPWWRRWLWPLVLVPLFLFLLLMLLLGLRGCEDLPSSTPPDAVRAAGGEDRAAEGNPPAVPEAAPVVGVQPGPGDAPPVGDSAPPVEPAAEAPASAPPDTAPPPPPSPEPAGRTELAIPENAAKAKRLDFLEGEWHNRSKLLDRRTGAPLQLIYRFKGKGAGEVVVRRPDGSECRAPARAAFDQKGRLSLEELDNVRCPDGTRFARSRTVCQRNPAGRTLCYGSYADGDTYQVYMERGS